jgi:hypothetical protein
MLAWWVPSPSRNCTERAVRAASSSPALLLLLSPALLLCGLPEDVGPVAASTWCIGGEARLSVHCAEFVPFCVSLPPAPL